MPYVNPPKYNTLCAQYDVDFILFALLLTHLVISSSDMVSLAIFN